MPILHWLDKDKHITTASKAPYRLLKLDPALSYGDTDTKNMIIQGDNLDALKALLPYYANSVKCIFIDPPYNTRSAFEHYDDNLEHTKWLEMMYPRLELLRELLAENGSIWITLDDNEAHYLKVMMDEIFGRKNFFSNIVWQHSVQGKNDVKTVSLNHNHIITYTKSDKFIRNTLERTVEHNKNYSNPDNDPRGLWRSGDFRSPNNRDNLKYDIITPSGKTIAPPEKGWRWSKETLEGKVKSKEITFINNEKKILRKIYLDEQTGRVPESIWFGSETGTTREANTELKNLFTTDIFDTPKPERLIERILHIATNPNDIVLDSFLGSGTTAAVAHKMGRQYIGIEMGEHAKTHCVERLKKVTQGEQGGISKAVNWQGGGGFAFYHLGESIFDDDGRINADIKFYELASHIWFSETKTPLAKIPNTPLLGVHNNVAYYLLYNGILGDKRPAGGNVLTSNVFDSLPKHEGKKVIYGETCRMGSSRLDAEKIIFKQTPYDIKGR